MVHGTRNQNYEGFLECWDLLYELKLLAGRPSADPVLQTKIEMLVDIYQEKFSRYWKFLETDLGITKR